MSPTNQTILEDLRDIKITPARSNDEYIFCVQSWYWNLLADSDLPFDCLTLQNWVGKESMRITDYFKRIWEDHKGRYDAVLRNHKDFLGKLVEIPGNNILHYFHYMHLFINYDYLV